MRSHDGSVLSLGCISSSPVSSCSICRGLTSRGAARPWQSLWQFITSEKCHYAVGGTDCTPEQRSSVLWPGAALSMSCWSPDFGKQMKRKEDRRDNIVYEIRQVIKRRKIFGSPPLVASDCTRWEEVWCGGRCCEFRYSDENSSA